MTDDRTSGAPRGAGAEPRVPDSPQPSVGWSRSDPMAVPTTSPLWTYEQQAEPPATGFDSTSVVTIDGQPDGPVGRRRGPALGLLALLLAIIAAVVEIAGIGASVAGDFATGTMLAVAAIGASVGAIVVGIVATILRAGRTVAIVAAVLGVVVNPIVLIWVLGFFAGVASID